MLTNSITTTIKVMAESFADAGIPVFIVDVKGDVSGTCKEGTEQRSLLNIPCSGYHQSVNGYQVITV